MASIVDTPRLLSVQSHVVSGYCGNKSATFPLQLLEFEVDIVNSVQLSNHTQYKVTRGKIFDGDHLKELHSGLKANNILPLYDHILSGYVADVKYIESLADLVRETKLERKEKGLSCLYTLDPVLGDDGTGYYVPNGQCIADAYKKNVLPLADILTPNRFEASILSGVNIDSDSDQAMEQATQAIEVFHKMGIKVVIITSMELHSEEELTCILSSRLDGHERVLLSIRVPKLQCPFTGTGDLFAALITGWLTKTNFDVKKSFENTVNSIHEILEDTLTWCKHRNDFSVQNYELRLVQNKAKIMNPSKRFEAKILDITSLSEK